MTVELGIQASRITRLRNGKLIAYDCLMNYSQPVSIKRAIELVRDNKVAFVAREDAPAVLRAVQKL